MPPTTELSIIYFIINDLSIHRVAELAERNLHSRIAIDHKLLSGTACRSADNRFTEKK